MLVMDGDDYVLRSSIVQATSDSSTLRRVEALCFINDIEISSTNKIVKAELIVKVKIVLRIFSYSPKLFRSALKTNFDLNTHRKAIIK